MVLPPIYNLDPKYLIVNKENHVVKLIMSDVLWQKESPFRGLSATDLRHKSPEELSGFGRSPTTPFWVLGVMLYEATIGINPWATVLKTQVTEEFIKKYPVIFEEEPEESFEDIVTQLLIKNPL
jgi:hypothetical protein